MRRSCRCSLILCVGLFMAGSGAIVSSGSGETRLTQHHETDRSIDPDRIAMTGCAADGYLSPMTATAERKGAPADIELSRGGRMEMIRISRDGRGFEFAGSGKPFRPWGHNYGPDFKLLEDYWTSDWRRIVEDFSEMKAMGANVVRVHLQLARFMDGPDRPNRASLAQLRHLIRLAEETGASLRLASKIEEMRSLVEKLVDNEVRKSLDQMSEMLRERYQAMTSEQLRDLEASMEEIEESVDRMISLL